MIQKETEESIVESYKSIQHYLQKLSYHLRHTKNYFFWLDTSAENRVELTDPIERLIYVSSLMTLHPNQKSKTVLLCPGFIAADTQLYDTICQLNNAKKTFQHHMVTLRKDLLQIEESTLDNQFGNPSHERPKVVHNFLQKIKLEHLHFKHVYRCFPVLEATPTQLSWTWAHTQSIKRVSHEQAIGILNRRNKTEKYNDAIEAIKSLPPHKILTLRQKLKAHLRVNVTYEERKRSMLKGTMPIVFPMGESMPKIKPARPVEEQKERAKRRDKKTSEEPLVAAIRLFVNND